MPRAELQSCPFPARQSRISTITSAPYQQTIRTTDLDEFDTFRLNSPNRFSSTMQEGFCHGWLVGGIRSTVKCKVSGLVGHLHESIRRETVTYTDISQVFHSDKEGSRVMKFLPYFSNSSEQTSFWQIKSLRRVSPKRTPILSSGVIFQSSFLGVVSTSSTISSSMESPFVGAFLPAPVAYGEVFALNRVPALELMVLANRRIKLV